MLNFTSNSTINMNFNHVVYKTSKSTWFYNSDEYKHTVHCKYVYMWLCMYMYIVNICVYYRGNSMYCYAFVLIYM